MTVPEALEVKQELETIDDLLKQLEEAAKSGKIGIIDMEKLSEFASQQTWRTSKRCDSRSKTWSVRWLNVKAWNTTARLVPSD